MQNYDGSNYGDLWWWADHPYGEPLRSPNPDTDGVTA
jgi:hypothetical protein